MFRYKNNNNNKNNNKNQHLTTQKFEGFGVM